VNWKIWALFLAGGVGALGAPYYVAYQLQLGDFAKSPQTVEINLGTTALVAGGRAKLWFASVDIGPSIEVSCKKEKSFFEVSKSAPSEEVCGVRVRCLDVFEKEFRGHKLLRGRFEITWDDTK
jgi:hypothetical protein